MGSRVWDTGKRDRGFGGWVFGFRGDLVYSLGVGLSVGVKCSCGFHGLRSCFWLIRSACTICLLHVAAIVLELGLRVLGIKIRFRVFLCNAVVGPFHVAGTFIGFSTQ